MLGFVSSVIVKVNIESIVTYMCYILYKHCIICDIKHQYSCQQCTILYVFLKCFSYKHYKQTNIELKHLTQRH
jgi:xylose isomerase